LVASLLKLFFESTIKGEKFLKNLRKGILVVLCLTVIGVLAVTCSAAPTNLTLNATTDLAKLQALAMNTSPSYNGFTFGSSIVFDSANAKDCDGASYTGRIKLGGSDPVLRGIRFTAKAGDVLTALAISSSSTGTGRNVMIAPFADGAAVAGKEASLGEAGTTAIAKHTYTIPADGTYVIYSSSSGINFYAISVVGK
jgi:hypothetical protein